MIALILFPFMVIIGWILIALLGFIGAIPVFFLWNWLMPALFGLPIITYMQAWGIFLLAGMLFKTYNAPNSEG